MTRKSLIHKLMPLICAVTLVWNCAVPAVAQESLGAQEDATGQGNVTGQGDATGQEYITGQGGATSQEGATGQEGTAGQEGGTSQGDVTSQGDATGQEGATGQGNTNGQETPTSYVVELGPCRIGSGESLSYTTISSEFAGGNVMEGYYPGELTVKLTGPIVIESGGSLSIGPLSLGGAEASPVLSGELSEEGLIVVEPGGSLRLSDVTVDVTGTGLLIVQKPGGIVETVWTSLPEELVSWSAPLVNNYYDTPDDVWLEAGTVLTENMLPDTMWVDLLKQGTEDDAEVSLAWDLSGYDGRTDGELTLYGKFLDETGAELLSVCPLEITVHWYTPKTLAVLDAVWKGSTVPVVQLVVQNLPEDADVWGEVSTDGGVTWERWEDEEQFFIAEAEPVGQVCTFALPDETPRWFRVVAETPWWSEEYMCWYSDAMLLSPPDDGDDSGGNRGGSTTPESPDRQPEPPDRPGTSGNAGSAGDTPEEVPEELPQEEPDTGAVSPPEIPDATESLETTPSGGEADRLEVILPDGEVQDPDPAVPETTEPAQRPEETAEDPAGPAPEGPPEADPPEESPDTTPQGPDTGADEAETGDPPTPTPPPEGSGVTVVTPGRTLPNYAQALLAAAGLGACALVGVAVAGVGPFRRFRKKK